MTSLLGPTFVVALPDLVALGRVEQTQWPRSLDLALHQQRVWAQPLDQQAVLVRGTGCLDLDMVQPQRLADVGRRRPVPARRRPDTSWRVWAVIVRLERQVMQRHRRELEMVWV